jgi:hypothetical protein
MTALATDLLQIDMFSLVSESRVAIACWQKNCARWRAACAVSRPRSRRQPGATRGGGLSKRLPRPWPAASPTVAGSGRRVLFLFRLTPPWADVDMHAGLLAVSERSARRCRAAQQHWQPPHGGKRRRSGMGR